MGNTLNVITYNETRNISELYNYTDGNTSDQYIIEHIDSILLLRYSEMDDFFVRNALAITILYTIICIMSIFGNLITCIVISTNSKLQNATNCYLFSLSVSDVILAISGSFIEIFNAYKSSLWPQGPCAISYFLFRVSSNTSVLIVLAISIERYLAVCYPFSFKAIRGIKRSIGIILAIWIICFILAYPRLYRNFKTIQWSILTNSGKYLNIKYDLGICKSNTLFVARYLYNTCMVVIFFIIPMIIIVFVYIRIAMKIQNSLKNINLAQQLESHNRHRSIKMLFAVVVVNFLCWTPRQAFYMMDEYSDFLIRIEPHVHSLTDAICKAFFVCSAFFNPIIYNVMSRQFRDGFLKMLWSMCRKERTRTETVQLVSIIPIPE